jgi:hypothetical protein
MPVFDNQKAGRRFAILGLGARRVSALPYRTSSTGDLLHVETRVSKQRTAAAVITLL